MTNRALLKRIEALEAAISPKDDLIVVIKGFSSPGPLTGYRLGLRDLEGCGETIERSRGESDDQLQARAVALFKSLRPSHPVICISEIRA